MTSPTPLQRIAFIAALAGMAGTAYASVLVEAGKSRYRVFAGIRPDVVFCVDGICEHISPSEARYIASALVIAAQEQEAKK